MRLYLPATNLYIAESGKVNTETSVKSFRKVMRRLQHSHPDHEVGDFTTDDLTAFCFARFQGEGPLAPNTVKQRKAYVVALYKWLTWKRVVEENPAADLEFSVQPRGGNVRMGKWMDKSEVVDIWKAFDISDPVQRRNRLIVLFGVVTGMRVVELEQVTWDKFTPDMWFIRGIVGKGRKPVDIKLSAQLREELMAWRKLAWMGAKAVFPTVKKKGVKNGSMGGIKFVTVLDWDTPLRDYGLRHAVRGAGDRIGVKLNPHDLRRSLAGILKSEGKDLEQIRDALRHTNIATTVAYLRKDPSSGHEATSGLEFLL